MSIAPHTGIVDFGTFTAPTASTDGIQGEVPQPLAGQEGYVLTGTGWASAGSVGLVGYQGTWNALTNTPTLTSSVGVQGYYYVVDVAGTTNLNGITDWQVGDWAIFNGSIWQKVDNTDSYDPANVAITGGTINNTTVGATTPSTGVFTTLTATGTSYLGGSSTSRGVQVDPVASGTTTFTQFTKNTGINEQQIIAANTSNLGLIATGGGTINFYTASNNTQKQLVVAATSTAVNYVQVTGAATGSGPTISSQGSDANARLLLNSKGSSSGIDLLMNNSRQVFIGTNGSAVNYLLMGGTATGFGPAISAAGSDTNIPLVLQPKGTGALQAQQTDSTATGGNARGINAVDWQTSRDAASRVASGLYSVVGGGGSNSATNTYSAVFSGLFNTASNLVSVVTGGQANTASGYLSFVGGGISNTAGSRDVAAVAGGQANTAAGYHNFIGGGFTNSGTSGSAVTTQSGTMNGTTAVTLSGSNASIKVGQLITGTSINTSPYTYVAAISGTSLTLSQVASGSSTSTLSFYTPHGVVVGGGNNQATGSYSFIGGGGDAGTAANRNVASGDWSTVAGGRKNTASGVSSFVGGGGTDGTNTSGNTASANFSSVVGGYNNGSSGQGSFVGGGQNNTANSTFSAIVGGGSGTARSVVGNHVFPACVFPISGSLGITQSALLVLARETTNATATVLCSDSSSAGTTNQVILPNNSAYYFRGEVVSGITGGGNTKGWFIEGVIKRGANAASTALVGTPTVTSLYADAGAATWTIALSADTTNGGLAVTFTGQLATTIRVVAKISTTEMTF